MMMLFVANVASNRIRVAFVDKKGALAQSISFHDVEELDWFIKQMQYLRKQLSECAHIPEVFLKAMTEET